MGMIQRARNWLSAPGVFESGRRFEQAMAASRALRAEDAAAERALAGDSEPPPAAPDPERDNSGPDILDGMVSGLRP